MASNRIPTVPVPIYQPSSQVQRFIVYDVDTITWLRREHNILGVLIGTLPQIPSQNVFLGLPLELQPEEARLLVDKGLAFVVDDLKRHQMNLQNLDPATSRALRSRLDDESSKLTQNVQREQRGRKEKAVREAHDKVRERGKAVPPRSVGQDDSTRADETIFAEPRKMNAPGELDQDASKSSWVITPASSVAMAAAPVTSSGVVPEVNAPAYALFKHLHNLGYFMTPGLRFGCRFSVYPGDPLRYHSHFLATGVEWDEEINLIDLVGGGRLGTGVKKAWLVGGPHASRSEVSESHHKDDLSTSTVRTFCIEWGGM